MNRKRVALAATVSLIAGLVAMAPASALHETPFVSIVEAPEEAAVEVDEHLGGQEFTESRPLADGSVGPAPAFLADDAYGCAWGTAMASGADEWIGVALRGQGTDVDPGDPEPDQCPGFQAKFSAAVAAGASALVVVSHIPLDGGGFLAVSPTIPGMMLGPDDGDRLVDSLDPDDPVMLSVGLLDPQTLLPPWEAAPTEVDDLTASAENGSVSVSGTARFHGESPVVVGFDGAGNAPIDPSLAALGLDATEIAIRQSHAAIPSLEFIIRVTELNHQPPPEVVRYLWQFQIDGEEYWVQAKTSDVSTGTAFADDPDGTLTNIPGSFRLRGDCGSVNEDLPVDVRTCRHLAWIDGVFDTNRNEVRMTVPFHLVPELQPGAAITDGIMDASIQAGISNATTSNTIQQFFPYSAPQREVLVGIVPSGEEPAFTDAATLGSGNSFSATLDTSGLASGDHDVWVQACFGTNCSAEMTTISL